MNDLIERLRLGDGTSPDHLLLLEAADALEKPVGWIDNKGNMICTKINESCKPLYTTSPQRPWVGLTREEIYACDEECNIPQYDITNADLQSFAKAIEAKLKEKNT